MTIFARRVFVFAISCLAVLPAASKADDVKDTEVHARIKAYVDSIPAIDTHSHLRGFSVFKETVDRMYGGEKRMGCGLRRLWRSSYFTNHHSLAPWPQEGGIEAWWTAAQRDFNNSRARSAYRGMLPIFTDLYGVDFETLTPADLKKLNDRIEKNMVRPEWAEEAICKKGNVEVVVVDAYWRPLNVRDHFPFTVSTFHVTRAVQAFHPSESGRDYHSPYLFAKKHHMKIETLDDYVAVVDRIVAEAKKAGVVCLKSAIAYQRTIKFDRVSKSRAEEAFGKTRKELTPAQIKAFEDYMFWKMCQLAAKHDLPFQIHTGHARIQSSNPMNLVNLIHANPRTKFILFHGGFPWVGESGMIALRYPNVSLDSVWLPTLSYTMAKRAYKEWLDMFSSNRIMWGSDMNTIEGTYSMGVYTRRCIAEALAEKVVAKELREEDARRIARQILRENALAMFPSLRKRVKPWPAAKGEK